MYQTLESDALPLRQRPRIEPGTSQPNAVTRDPVRMVAKYRRGAFINRRTSSGTDQRLPTPLQGLNRGNLADRPQLEARTRTSEATSDQYGRRRATSHTGPRNRRSRRARSCGRRRRGQTSVNGRFALARPSRRVDGQGSRSRRTAEVAGCPRRCRLRTRSPTRAMTTGCAQLVHGPDRRRRRRGMEISQAFVERLRRAKMIRRRRRRNRWHPAHPPTRGHISLKMLTI